MSPLKVACLLSLGQHPASGRLRHSQQDARALEIALALPNVALRCFYAGPEGCERPLRAYLGMGLPTLTRIDVNTGDDICPPLIEALRHLKPDLVLSGQIGEHGRGSGLVPYVCATALGYPLAAGITQVERDGHITATLIQALPRGRRRVLDAVLPIWASISHAAPAPRQSAYAKAMRGIIEIQTPQAHAPDTWAQNAQLGPKKSRPKRLANTGAKGSAQVRLKVAMEAKSVDGALLVDPAPEEGAREILDCLKRLNILTTPEQEKGLTPYGD